MPSVLKKREFITYIINLFFESMRKFYFLSLLAMLFCGLSVHAADTKTMTLKNLSIAEGTELAGFERNQQITFNTDMDDAIGYMYAEIVKGDGEVVGTRTTVYDPDFNPTGVKDDKNPRNLPQNKKSPNFTFVSSSNYTFYAGQEYTFVFTAFENKEASQGAGTPLAVGKVTYKGTTPVYTSSSVKLLSISPDPSNYIIKTDDAAARTVTLTFSDKVRLDIESTFVETSNLSSSSATYQSITPGDDAETIDDVVYSSTWALTPRLSTISDGFDIVYIADAYDKSGLHVTKTAEGLEDYSTGDTETGLYSISISNDFGKDSFTITPKENDEYVNSLFSFRVSNTEKGIFAANIDEPAILYQVAENGDKEKVAEINLIVDDLLIPGDPTQYKDDQIVAQRLFLDKQITKAGKYILHFPRGFFLFGTGIVAGSSAETEVEYTIAQDFVAPKAELVGSPEVKKLEKLEIYYPELTMVGPAPSNATAYVFDENKELVTKAEVAICWDHGWDANYVDVNLKTPIVTPGKYTLIVPQDAIANSDESAYARNAKGGADTSGDAGKLEYTLVGAFIQELTVVGGSIDDIKMTPSIENNSTVGAIESIDLTFESVDGEAVSVAVDGWDTDAMWGKGEPPYYATEAEVAGNVVTVKPYTGNRHKAYGISDEGTYSVTFPEGFFIVNGSKWPSFTLTYTVNPTLTGINSVETGGAASDKQVYTLSGVKVNGKAQKGVFIINGKKVVLK